MSGRRITKRVIQTIALAVVFPSALLCAFGRIERLFNLFAQIHALTPGFIGDFCRSAFYKLTLDNCSIDTTISFGSYFSRRAASVEPVVSIGAYCVIGCVRIGTRTQIGSHVEMPGGRYSHTRDSNGSLASAADREIVIGADCWIGTSAIIMANVGAGTTIGAGSVVIKDVPGGVVAVGNPARVIRNLETRIAE